MKVSIIIVTLFAITKCIYAGDDVILAPISTAGLESDPKRPISIQPRIKRQAFGLVNRRLPSGLQPREQTVIVVPGTGATGYRGVNSPYGSNGVPNRGTTVVVSQVPEYAGTMYSSMGSYDGMPVNSARL